MGGERQRDSLGSVSLSCLQTRGGAWRRRRVARRGIVRLAEFTGSAHTLLLYTCAMCDQGMLCAVQ